MLGAQNNEAARVGGLELLQRASGDPRFYIVLTARPWCRP